MFFVPLHLPPGLCPAANNRSIDSFASLITSRTLPEEIAKKTGKYGHVGVTLLGRMAVAEKYKGTGLGALTLPDFYQRTSARLIPRRGLVPYILSS